MTSPARRLVASLFVLSACGRPAAPPRAVPAAPAAAAAQKPDPLDQPLPIDPRVRVGRLDNGLTYYVLAHGKPEKRAALWLAVDAGSVLEDDDQRGLAHFVEHMAFNGTRRFPEQAIVRYIEATGMSFGADLNAYTDFDETVYQLTVPTDGPAFDTGLDILRDWADGVTFEADEVAKERGVVIEEWRLDRGAEGRIADKQVPVLYRSMRYADRLVFGLPEVLRAAPRDALVRFYRDWYRPDLMAVIAVGDFDPAATEARIRARFADLPAPAAGARARPVEVMPRRETAVSIETDPEMTVTQVSIHDQMPRRPEVTGRDYRRFVGEQLYHKMLNTRLQEISERPDSPWVTADSNTATDVRPVDQFVRAATVKEGREREALAALFEEVLRVERHGFTAQELERARLEVQREYQELAVERDKAEGTQLAEEIVSHFLLRQYMPGIEAERQLAEELLPGYTLAELDRMAGEWGAAGSRVILLSGPATMKKPSRSDLLAVVDEVSKREIAAYRDPEPDPPLFDLPHKLEPGSVVERRTIPSIGVTEWRLSNGVRVVLKPTDFKNDEVLVEAFSPGGTSVVKDADYDSARFAAEIVDESGLGEFDPAALRRVLSGRRVALISWIQELEQGMTGRASPIDLDALFHLMALHVIAPRRDERAFAAWRARQQESVRNRLLDPERSFLDEMSTFIDKDHPRRRPVTLEALARVDLDRALAIYRERFADAGAMTVVLVGNLDPQRVEDLARTYLASLPSARVHQRWRDLRVTHPSGVKERRVRRGGEPRSLVYLYLHGRARWSKEADNDMRMLDDVVAVRLREVLREDMGGIYGADTGGAILRRPREERAFMIVFGCAPENADKLIGATRAELTRLARSGIAADYAETIRKTRLREMETNLKDNHFWSSELVEAYKFGDDPTEILDYRKWADQVTPARIQKAAQRYLSQDQYVLGVLLPDPSP